MRHAFHAVPPVTQPTMPVTDIDPSLPGLYELVTLDEADSARAHAERLAARGADEGTLVWAKKQTEGLGRRGKYWISGSNNLHCAVILRPEEPLETCCQLGLLASVCACQAITVVGEPMEELRLEWPNDVLLNRGKVAGVHLSGSLNASGIVDWLVISLNVNTREHPESLGFAASSLKGEGFEIHERVTLLEGYARELLAWLNRWADEGLAPVRKAWLWRGDWTDAERRIEYHGTTYQGKFDSLSEDGALSLETGEGIISMELAEFYRPEFATS